MSGSAPINVTKMTIPEIRSRLIALAAMLRGGDGDIFNIANEITWLANETRRKPSLYPATRRRKPQMSEEKAQRIREYKATHPNVSLNTIGNIFSENIGRVSEVINGYRSGHSTDAA